MVFNKNERFVRFSAKCAMGAWLALPLIPVAAIVYAMG